MPIENLQKVRIAILHAFFKNKGGAEKLVFDIRNRYKAELYAGALRTDVFSPDKQDVFSRELFDSNYKFEYLHLDGKIPVLYHLVRQLHFLFNPKIKKLRNFDILIFSGNIFWVVDRLIHFRKKTGKPKLVTYCNTPPRIFTDQEGKFLASKPQLMRPFLKLLGFVVRYLYARDLKRMDLVISNSQNIQRRIKKYLNIDTLPLYPAVHTDRFKYIQTQDYFLSHSRLEDMKRIRLIVEAFAKMPDKRLIVTSTGPLKSWLENYITQNTITNIQYLGIVSDEELAKLVGECLAGIVIPVDEDAGIVQVELMAAGKPVIGVREGGLLETVIDGETGFLIPSNPSAQDLIKVVNKMDKKLALSMKDKCISHAQQYSVENFFQKMDSMLQRIV